MIKGNPPNDNNQKQIGATLIGVKKFIDEFYYKKITLQDLASIACKEKHHFVRCFKRNLGEDKIPNRVVYSHHIKLLTLMDVTANHNSTNQWFVYMVLSRVQDGKIYSIKRSAQPLHIIIV
jgi:hypothetical protein